MDFNWVDVILFIILALTLIIGLVKGLIRQVIGLVAAVVGLILALVYYPYVSEFFLPLVRREVIAQFLGFLAIFFVVLCVGWLFSSFLSKLMKGPLKFMNHLLGGGLGLLKGLLISGVIVFAMLVFPVNTEALRSSKLAPVCLWMTQAVVDLIPQDLQDRFKQAYEDILGGERDERKI